MRLIFCVCLLTILMSCSNTPSDSFTLEGSVKGLEEGETITLFYPLLQNDQWCAVTDTTKVIDGKFFFKGKIDELTPVSLYLGDIFVQLYIEPADMKLMVDMSQPYAYELSGAEVEKENIELKKELASDEKKQYEKLIEILKVLEQINSLTDEGPVRDSLINVFEQCRAERNTITERLDKTRLDFVLKHNTYRIAPHLLYLVSRNDIVDGNMIKSIYNGLPEQSKATSIGKLAFKQIESQEMAGNSMVGGIAPDFKVEDLSGKTVQLSEFRNNNYVLLDFWASWCGPCIKEIPKMKKIHSQYKEKGLVIIGISCDTERENWLKAVDKHELGIWSQILSAQGADNALFNQDDIADFYKVDAIPFCVLVDKQGKIVARWQHIGDEQLIELDNILKTSL